MTVIKDGYEAVDEHLRPAGSPQNWSVYRFDVCGQGIPQGLAAWKGSVHMEITRGPRKGQRRWDKSSHWHRIGFIPLETLNTLTGAADPEQSLEMEG